MKAFYRDRFLSEKSEAEIMDFMKSVTVHACDNSKRGRKAEFRGYIWDKGFMVSRNLNYRNSFNAVAKVSLKETPDGTEVELGVGMNMAVFIFMCLWSTGVLFFGLEMAYYLASERGSGIGWLVIAILSLFFFVAYLLLRFGLYESYKKLKKRMIDILS